MSRFWNAALLSAALMVPIAMAPTTLRAQDQRTEDRRTARSYHDKKHNDDHEWNDHEDRAYRAWTTQNHRNYKDFSKIRENDRQKYWGWRHEHSDALLKIDIH